MAAAALGIQTPNFKALLLGAKTAIIQDKLQRAATESLHKRQADLDRQAEGLLRAQRALEDLKLMLEKRADRLAEVDQALERALITAAQQRERGDRLSKRLSILNRAALDAGVEITPH